MSQEVWKYISYVPNTTKKAVPGVKRKSEVADKEVLNLTGGLFPLKLVDPVKDAANVQSSDRWLYLPIKQRDPKIGPIYHWVKEGEEEKMFQGDKFNIDPNIIQFSEDQYAKIAVNHEQWPYDRVVELFDKLKTYNFNFIVARDRLQRSPQWDIEDMKDIYFTVCRLILQQRGETENMLSTYVFDKKYQTNRKFQLENYMMRSKTQTERERFLINEIKKLQVTIKKEQREQINLKKALKLDESPEELFKLKDQADVEQLWKKQKVFSRQQYLGKPLHLPGKIEDKLSQVLSGLNIPDKIIATRENAKIYDDLRKSILLMFSIQRYVRKKESEKRTLDDRKKRLATVDDDKQYPYKPTEGIPKKKVNKN